MARSPVVRAAALVAVALALGSNAAATPIAVGRVALAAGGYLGGAGLRVSVRVAGGREALARAGFAAEAMSADVAALSATPAELARLFAIPNVAVIEEARTLSPLLDVSAAAIGAPAARQATGLDGSGVLVGVVDTGLDLAHADFRRADGSTRVAALLDLSRPRTLHPELPDYGGGELYLGADIDAGRADSTDTNGHGTHVAGIAAGNGLASGRGFPAGRYVGIAPGADLVIVQARRDATSGFVDSDVATGCRFVLDVAARLGRPVVVNLSLGGSGGGHDGSSNFELALDELFAPDAGGRALVIAAGNDGDRDQHAGAWGLDGRVVVPVEVSPAELAIEVWYRGTLSLSLTSPSGKRSRAVASGQLASDDTGEGRVLVDNASTGPHLSGRRSASIVVMTPKSGGWSVVLDGAATRWDAYVTASGSRFTGALSEDGGLTLPASARHGIVAGSFVTKSRWTGADGATVTSAAVTGEVSSFSSSGPTADGRFAPDLIAPGEFIASARSADASFADPGYVGDDGVHVLMRGTSQAAPHVAGTIALLLGADATLGPAALREILRVSARDRGAGFSPRRGFGWLDAAAALAYVRGARASVASATVSSVGVSRDLVPPGDETTVVSVTPRGSDGTPLGPGHAVTISASAGDAAGGVVDTGFGRYERTFAAHAPRGSVAVVSASVDGVPLAAHPSIFFVDARADVGAAFRAGGGCALSPAPALPALALLFAVAALLGAALHWRTGPNRARRLGREE